MPNTISYTSKYMDMLDRIFKREACTGILESDPGQYRFDSVSDKTIYLQNLTTQGMGTYNRGTGYTKGTLTVGWDAYTFATERGRSYDLDIMDEKEAMVTVAKLMSEIMRTNIIPEIDAYRFSKLVSLCGLDASVNLTYDTAVEALDTGIQTLDDAEVQKEGRVLFVSNEFHKLLRQSGEWYNSRSTESMNTRINRNITTLEDMPIIPVPTARFKSAFTFYDGVTGGQEAGGFVPAGGAKSLNFMIVPLSVVIAVIKHMSPKIVAPQYNTTADGYLFAYRLYHDLFVPNNKLTGVYIHSKA